MLTFFPSNRTENLAFIIAEIMRRSPLQNVFSQEKIIIQSYGMGTWLQQQISAELGVAAMIDCSMPASFIWHLSDIFLPEENQVQGFEKQNLRWEIYQRLPEKLALEEYEQLSCYVNAMSAKGSKAEEEKGREVGSMEGRGAEISELTQSPEVMFDLACALADVFDAYQNYRPEWIEAWEQGKCIADIYQTGEQQQYAAKAFAQLESWQSDLWRSVYPSLDLSKRLHRSSLLSRLQEKISRLPKASTIDLPERIFVFGLSALPPRLLAIIKALAQHIDIHVVVNNPCRYYWGDVLSTYQQLKLNQSLLASGVSVETAADSFLENNALLASWGRLGRDYMSLLMNEDIFSEVASEFYDDVAVRDDAGEQCTESQQNNSPSALQHIQSDILNLRSHTHTVALADTSLRFANCHSPLREVEALHDYLIHSLDDDASMEVRDIIVMMPDIHEYAAYINAVFSRPAYDRHGQAQYLPYVIADQSLNINQPLLECVGSLLSLNTLRMTSAEVLDWLEFEAIRCRFDINEEELQRIHRWVDVLNVRWGISESHRDAILSLESSGNANTWLAAIKRLISGYILGSAGKVSFAAGDVLPYEVFGSDEQLLAGKLARYIDVIDWTLEVQQGSHSAQDCLLRVTEIWHRWTDAELLHEDVSMAMKNAVDSLRDETVIAGLEGELPFAIVAKQICASLEEEKVSQRFLSGRINFCTLMPMRSVPFSVVCLLGMNEGKYPRLDMKHSFDLMARSASKIGDRSGRDDDRYLFLEALGSARKSLYISYCGRSISDNSERFPSVLVSELQDYCRQYFCLDEAQDGDVILDAWTSTHRIQAFHSDYYQSASAEVARPSESLLKSYNGEWLPLLNRQSLCLSSLAEEKMNESVQSETNSFVEDPILHQFDMFASDSDMQELDGSDIQELNDSSRNEDSTAPTAEVEVLLTDLQQALSHPLRYYYRKQLGLTVGSLPDEFEANEPFSLNGLDAYQLKGDVLKLGLGMNISAQDGYSAANSVVHDVFDDWRLSGKLPRAPLDRLSYEERAGEVAGLLAYMQRRNENPIDVLRLPLDTLLGSVRLLGEILITGGQVLALSVSDNLGSKFFATWVKHVLWNYLLHSSLSERCELLSGVDNLSGESLLISPNSILIFPCLDAELAERYAFELLVYLNEIEDEPQAFLSKTAFALLFQNESKAKKVFAGANLGKIVIAGERDDVYWQRYAYFSDNTESTQVPDMSEFTIYRQIELVRNDFRLTDLEGNEQK